MPFFTSKDKQIKPLPFVIYFGTVFLLVASGLAVSVYLALSHYRVYTDIGYKSFCAISRAFNCDTVSQSPYAIFLDLPVSVWGIIGYGFFLFLLAFAWGKDTERKRIWPILVFTSLVYSAFSIILAMISTVYIRSYCIMCIASYGINFLLLFHTGMIRRRFDNIGLIEGLKLDVKYLWGKKHKSAPAFLTLVTVVILINIFFPHYWHFEMPGLAADIPKGYTEDGHPWIGAEKPELEITEFTDYQCFQCKKMHFFLRQIVANNPDKVRLVHRHYPMDQEFNPMVKEPFHVGSGKLALLAIYAAQKGKFWEINDLLFTIMGKKEEIDITELAEKTGMDYRELSMAVNDHGIHRKLFIDIAEGFKFKITGTPGYVIDGQVYLGEIPPEILRKVLD